MPIKLSEVFFTSLFVIPASRRWRTPSTASITAYQLFNFIHKKNLTVKIEFFILKMIFIINNRESIAKRPNEGVPMRKKNNKMNAALIGFVKIQWFFDGE